MTKLKRLLVLAVAGAALAIGQDRGDATTSLIYLPPVSEPGRALREYLNLTPAQVTALQDVQKSRRDAEQAIYNELRQKYTALNNLNQSGSTDYLQIGRLTVEIRELQKKLPISGEPYRTRALAVLSADQRAKLPALANALQLQWPANDAVNWNLLDRPPVSQDPRILPAFDSTAAQEPASTEPAERP